jgi:cyclopropane-fatty-acyl-phospholipid synthase
MLMPLRWLENSLRRNTRFGSRRNIAAHYDLNNDFFAQFLDPTMTYSCGIFESAEATMEAASLAKYECACRTLNLSTDDHLLEIGSGWGGLAVYAAKQFGCRVTTATVSREQYHYARQRIRAEGLDAKITLLLRDYRDLEGQFDKLVSIEMIEAVGHEFLPKYFRCCARLLRPGGTFFLQSITMPDQRYDRYRKSVDFVQRYIFPGGCVPSFDAIARAMETASDLQLVETEDFAAHYARTLQLWRERFFENIDTIRALGFTERLIRAWHYYLCYCEAGFREQRIGLAHLLLEKPRG